MRNHYANLQLSTIIFSGVIATLTLGSLPVFIARISQAFDLSLQQAGMLATSDLGGCAIGCVISLFLQNKVRWRIILMFAIAITCLGGFFSVLSADYSSLLASRFVAGFGNGFIVSLVFAALCATQNPDRNFGFYTFGQLIAQAITIPFFTVLVAKINVDAMAAVSEKSIEAELISADRAYDAFNLKHSYEMASLEFIDFETAFMMEAGQGFLRGKTAIMAERQIDDVPSSVHWQPIGSMGASSADLGITWGTFSVDGDPGVSGSYVTVWRKVDGEWKIVTDTVVDDPVAE